MPPTESTRPAPKSVLRRAAGAIRWSFVFDRFDVFTRGVEASDNKFIAPAGYKFRFGTAEDLDRCNERDTELGLTDREHGKLRLGAGHRLVLGLAGELPIFTMWINPRHLNIPGDLKRRLSADQVFIYKAFTSPDHRGRKLYQAGMAFVLADLAANGKRELVGYAHAQKQASRGGLARLGFHSAGTYRNLGLRSLRFTICSRRLNRHFGERVPRSGVDWT